MSKLKSLSSNQYYKGLNNRYDKRVSKLRKLKFNLYREAMFWYNPNKMGKKPENFTRVELMRDVMSNEFVYHADSRAFDERLTALYR